MANIVLDPGYYTKLKLDQNGNILDAGILEEIDIPDHKHTWDDIEGDFKSKVIESLTEFFTNDINNAVVFNFDEDTKTVSADIRYDDITIVKNEDGEIETIGESSSGSTSVDVDEIKSSLREELEESLKNEILSSLSESFINTTDNAVVFSYDPKSKTITADIRYDGYSIIKNEEGELESVREGNDDKPSSDCVTHTHTSNQIEDFESAVKKVIDELNIGFSIENLSNYIDNTTIIINSSGKLAAVSGSGVVEEHKHTISDIVDFPEIIPAALQPINDLGEDVNYRNGPIDLENLSIGYAVLSLNYYLENVINRKLNSLQTQINKVAQTSSNTNAIAVFKPLETSIHRELYDKQDNTIRDVYYSGNLKLKLEALPYDDCKLSLMVNGNVFETYDTSLITSVGYTSGIMYVANKVIKGQTSDYILYFNLKSFTDGVYTFQIRYDLGDNLFDYSEKIQLAITDKYSMKFLAVDNNNTHTINNVEYYDYPFEGNWYINIVDYDLYRFVSTETYTGLGKLVFHKISKDSTKDYRIIENLFEATRVDVYFDKNIEYSDSELYKNYIEGNSYFVNNILQSQSGNIQAKFKIPQSHNYNSIEFFGLNKVSEIILQKGDVRVSSNNLAELPDTPGRLSLDINSILISLLNSYDDGKSDINFIIKSTIPIDTSKVNYRLFNLDL